MWSTAAPKLKKLFSHFSATRKSIGLLINSALIAKKCYFQLGCKCDLRPLLLPIAVQLTGNQHRKQRQFQTWQLLGLNA